MTGLDDLRRTLETHADEVETGGGQARTSSVAHRIGAARRRRRAVVAGGAAAAVVVALGVAVVPDRAGQDAGPDPATVFGIDVPTRIDTLGFRYGLDEVVTGRGGEVVVELAPSDEPRLVSWATSADDDRVRVDSTGLMTPRDLDTADFADWTYIAAGGDATVAVTAESGDPAAAVYTLDPDVRPDGVTVDGVTFREQSAGAPLLDAAIGRAGDAEVEVGEVPADAEVRIGYFCSGGPANAWIHLEVTGEEAAFGRGCDDLVPIDAAAIADGTFTTAPVGRGARLYVTEGRNGPLLDDPDVRLGLGFYDTAPERSAPSGLSWPEQFEAVGRSWQLDGLVSVEDVGPDGATLRLPAGTGPRLAYPRWTGTGDSRLSVRIGGQVVTSAQSVGSGGIPGLPIATGDGELTVDASGPPVPAGALVGVAIYVPVD